MDHVRWLAEPALQRPTVIAGFTGWNDAGDAASSAVKHLVEQWGANALAEIDPEEFTDFATVRPHVRLVDGTTRTIVWPTVGVWSASTAGGDVIIVLGPEPALRWRLFAEQVIGIATRFRAGMVITLGALLADVPHTRATPLMGTATDQQLIDRFDLQRSRYEGPTGIVGVLHDACSRAGLPSASLWAAVPAYASQVPSPKAALALVSRVCSMIGTPVPVGPLRAQAADYETRVSAVVQADDDLIGYVSRLESRAYDDDYDALDDDITGGIPASDLGDIDGADEMDIDVDGDDLLAEVERFLRDHPETD